MTGAYPLSPMQGGMLYQSLLAEGAPEQAGYDIEQIQIFLRERVDATVLSAAWNEAMSRYPVLTSSICWRGVERPVQVLNPGVSIPFEVVDWTAGDVGQARRLFLEMDRRRGFNLSQAPLMRVTVAVTGADSVEVYWTLHHILIDGRSFARILHEVFADYAARQVGEVCSVRPPARSYVDYIAWLGRRDHVPSLKFFKTMLAGKAAPTPLPLAEPIGRPLAATGYGAVHRVLDADVHSTLEALASRHGTTMGGVVQVAWGVLLSRLTGDPDVVFGIARSCRYSALGGAAESIVGLLINTLPARIRIDDQASIGELLAAGRQQWLAQRNHDQTPLIDVQGQSEFAPDVPLFETLMMYDNREINEELQRLDPAWRTRKCVLHEQPSAPLALMAVDGKALELKLMFDRRRYTEEVVVRIADYLLATLCSLSKATLVGDIEVLSKSEAEQLLFAWNDSAGEFSHDRLIHQLFEARVDRTPDAPAVEVDGKVFTFAQIEARANQLANVLRARGIGPGCYVGVCLARGMELVAALLGIAKSGAAYVPIDPEYPPDRIAFMLADTQAKLVVSEARYAGLLATQTVLLCADAELLSAPASRPEPIAQPADTCYAIFTSGSTGKPKGVMLTHRAVVNTLEWVSRTFAVGPTDRALFVTSPCFDLSVYDVFGVLGAGGTVVVATAECLREPRALVQQLIDNRITIWDSAPAALQRLVPMFPEQGSPSLRLVMLSGDWIPLTLPDAVRRCFPNAQVMSLGGATEAAIWSNWYPIGAIDPRWTSIPYGRPIQNAQYHVLDKRRRPVPVGVTGDLYIAGTCLAEGYLNRPELTAERFVANPFRPGERMYATGDLARYFPDGNLEFLGRADFQVKIRGYRIELGEIEAALLALPGVRDALCIAFDDVSGAKALAAYVTARTAGALDVAELQAKLHKSLPEFMVPARFIVLPAMPLSVNGKVDRKALPAPVQTEGLSEYAPPGTDSEIRMAAIWRSLLKLERVGLHDNFFLLGGDSLLAVSLALEVEREFATEFPLSRVLEYPTLGALAAAIHSGVEKGRHLVTLNAGGTRTPLVLFCGIGGFGFFFHDLARQLGPDQPVHVLHAVGAGDDCESARLRVEELAAIYDAEITAVCAHGPVILGGYSFGALIAYEVARRFRDRGKQVPLVVSFDGPAPGHPKLLPLGPRLFRHLSDWWHLDGSARREYFRERIANIKRRFKPAEADVRLAPTELDPALQLRLRKIGAGLWWARDRYLPTDRIGCDLLLVQAENPLEWPGCSTDALYGWREFIFGKIDVLTVPGSHLQLFGAQNNALIAQAINARSASQKTGLRSAGVEEVESAEDDIFLATGSHGRWVRR